MTAPFATRDGPRLTIPGGLVVAHSHLYSALARGMPPPSRIPNHFLEILQNVWWRLDRALDLTVLRAAARWGVAEAAASGATCIIDHNESPHCIEGSLDVIADAMQAAGVRGVVAYGATARNFGEAEWRAGLAENLRFLKTNQRPLVRGLVGLHATFTLPDRALKEAAQVARDFGVGLHVHVAEDRIDADAIERLAGADALVPGSVFAHGVHATPAQVRKAVEAGVWFVHNPRSNALNRVGFADLDVAGSRVALGTDGVDGDMLAEARAAVLLASDRGKAVDALARLRAGQRLVEQLFGGPQDDSTILDYPAATAVHPENIGSHLLFGHPTVAEVRVAGRPVSVDLATAAHRGQAQAQRLWEAMAGLQAEPSAEVLAQRLQGA